MARATIEGQCVSVGRDVTTKGTEFHVVTVLQKRVGSQAELVRVRFWNANGHLPKEGDKLALSDVQVRAYVSRASGAVVTFDRYFDKNGQA